ncbi:FAD:protein FMN transferase [Catellatospora chokoriensis]|uniref:FAD:protein FMN transferase n=2 Tax=Catellatospora chokoriensis TaxID=310353 RepID=A0A8J3NVI2_9ACTN|nr:FAD:protein FMN transferase [Catellatospora chokoriensis]GIF94002.1 FAD:protein FMN transferase [Catellatospora chokoriensis]
MASVADRPRGLRCQDEVMGTVATVHIAEDWPPARLRELADLVFTWLHEVDRRFSTYRPDSEVNRLDRRELATADCSADLRHVLDQCAEFWRRTDGYFDAYATGRLDPSGYVKGWSVQVASEMLRAAGANNHSIDAGGDFQLAGRPAPDEQWLVGIRHPWQRDRVAWVVTGTDLAVATSGTYERGAHVTNPHDGRPARDLVSVTVAGPRLAEADAYATAALAMGLPALRWLATLDGYESAVITSAGDAYRSDGLPVAACWPGRTPP